MCFLYYYDNIAVYPGDARPDQVHCQQPPFTHLGLYISSGHGNLRLGSSGEEVGDNVEFPSSSILDLLILLTDKKAISFDHS